ncbi:MAG: hypothetical protein DHS20C16_30060 [Phycisphaerae bacterium]|nr:MAG: hypothetical protein DHS20C16_30060 [Phycisphaerae bacterium]
MANAGGNLKAVVMSNLKASPAKSAILLLGFAVLVVLIVRQVWGGPDEAVAGVPTTELASVDPDAVEGETTTVKPVVRVPRPRIVETLSRDPFAMDWLDISGIVSGEGDTEIEDDVLQLQLTLTGKDEAGQATAVVSGTVVHVGDQIAGFVIDRINKRSVVLRKGSEKLKLRMP